MIAPREFYLLANRTEIELPKWASEKTHEGPVQGCPLGGGGRPPNIFQKKMHAFKIRFFSQKLGQFGKKKS